MPFQFDTQEELETRKSHSAATGLGRAVDSDTEIALGTRSLLGIFFGLVLICSIFFGLGYSVGRAGGSRAAMQPDSAPPVPDSRLSKPSPQQTLTPVEPPTTAAGDSGDGTAGSGSAGPEPVSETTTGTGKPGASAPGSGSGHGAAIGSGAGPASGAGVGTQTPAKTALTTPPVARPVVTQPAPAPAPAAFMVQVAAVRIPQDAQILVDVLKKHGYAAVVRNEPRDQLLHVQLGPFATRADAMAMRAKLLADGYNAVVK